MTQMRQEPTSATVKMQQRDARIIDSEQETDWISHLSTVHGTSATTDSLWPYCAAMATTVGDCTDVIDSRRDVFCAGFRDCTDETIHFLIEEEGMSPDDPIIHGLRQYLLDKERTLCPSVHAQQISTARLSLPTQHPAAPTSYTPHTLLRSPPLATGLTRFHSTSIDTRLDDSGVYCNTADDSVLTSDVSSTYGDILTPTPYYSNSEGLSVSRSTDRRRRHSVAFTEDNEDDVTDRLTQRPQRATVNSPSDLERHLGNAEAARSVLVDFLSLAQNNSDIASVTRRLLDLLEEEEGDTESESDEEDNVTTANDSDTDEQPVTGVGLTRKMANPAPAYNELRDRVKRQRLA